MLINNTQTNYIPPNDLGNIDTFQMNFSLASFDNMSGNTVSGPYSYSGINSTDIPIAYISQLNGRTIHSFGAVIANCDSSFSNCGNGFSVSLIDGTDPFDPTNNPELATVYTFNTSRREFDVTIGPYTPFNNVLAVIINYSSTVSNTPVSGPGSIWSILLDTYKAVFNFFCHNEKCLVNFNIFL